MKNLACPIVLLCLALALGLVGCATRSQGPVAVPTPTLPTPGGSSDGSATVAVPTLPAPTRLVDPYPPLIDQISAEPEAYPGPTAIVPTAEPTVIESGSDLGPDLAGLRVELQPVASGLLTPVSIANAADGSGRLFVVEKAGIIRVLRQGALNPAPFLDIRDRVGSGASEQGLLGLAFAPDYPTSGRFYVNYTDRAGDSVVSRFTAADGSDQADPGSEAIVLRQPQPADNHNGGHLAFGPDGYLYIGFGDGGGAGDRYGNGQNGATWLGALLRLDVSGELPYQIPRDNPFVADPAVRDEVWAIGLRNPWRYSFDRVTGELYIADVGQNRFEEVNLQPADGGGENYGWPLMEGAHCYPDDNGLCDRSGLVMPVVEYDHSQGCSVTGGAVYRGQAYPMLHGAYLFADYCSGRLWGMARAADGSWQLTELAQVNLRITSFGEDESGELYLVAADTGELYRIAATGG